MIIIIIIIIIYSIYRARVYEHTHQDSVPRVFQSMDVPLNETYPLWDRIDASPFVKHLVPLVQFSERLL